MKYIVTTPPAVEPITLEQAKLQTRASAADEPYLSLCIASARAHCEGIINQAIIRRTLEEAWDAFPAEELLLTARPAVSIESVTYTDTTGADATVAATGYTLENRGLDQWLLPALGASWPQTEASVNAVRVRYVVGLAQSAEDVPADLRAWMLLTLAYLYAQREAFDMTGKVAAIPNRFTDSLLDPWRVYGA